MRAGAASRRPGVEEEAGDEEGEGLESKAEISELHSSVDERHQQLQLMNTTCPDLHFRKTNGE